MPGLRRTPAVTVGAPFVGAVGFLWCKRPFEEQLYRCAEGHFYSVRVTQDAVTTEMHESVTTGSGPVRTRTRWNACPASSFSRSPDQAIIKGDALRTVADLDRLDDGVGSRIDVRHDALFSVRNPDIAVVPGKGDRVGGNRDLLLDAEGADGDAQNGLASRDPGGAGGNDDRLRRGSDRNPRASNVRESSRERVPSLFASQT